MDEKTKTVSKYAGSALGAIGVATLVAFSFLKFKKKRVVVITDEDIPVLTDEVILKPVNITLPVTSGIQRPRFNTVSISAECEVFE